MQNPLLKTLEPVPDINESALNLEFESAIVAGAIQKAVNKNGSPKSITTAMNLSTALTKVARKYSELVAIENLNYQLQVFVDLLTDALPNDVTTNGLFEHLTNDSHTPADVESIENLIVTRRLLFAISEQENPNITSIISYATAAMRLVKSVLETADSDNRLLSSGDVCKRLGDAVASATRWVAANNSDIDTEEHLPNVINETCIAWASQINPQQEPTT
jgi:hypothetical protein